jgi:RNA polymerase sigma-70 factor (ECF subfamily)
MKHFCILEALASIRTGGTIGHWTWPRKNMVPCRMSVTGCPRLTLGVQGIVSATDPRPLASTVVRDDEARLVSAAKAGDISAFEELVNRYERKIFRLGMNITQNREDAEDVMQDAFLKSYQNLDRFQGESRFYTWLVRIAINEALMKLRKRRPNQVSLDEPLTDGEDAIFREIEDWGPSPEKRFAQTELNEILTQAIGELDPIFRVVFLLRDVEGISTEETAQILGISVPAVKSRLLRARLKLRQRLNKHFRRSETQ